MNVKPHHSTNKFYNPLTPNTTSNSRFRTARKSPPHFMQAPINFHFSKNKTGTATNQVANVAWNLSIIWLPLINLRWNGNVIPCKQTICCYDWLGTRHYAKRCEFLCKPRVVTELDLRGRRELLLGMIQNHKCSYNSETYDIYTIYFCF